MANAVATIELISVARGVVVADAMLKAASVNIYEAHAICPGKYLIVIGGDVGAVKESLAAGERIGRHSVTDSMILPNAHPDIFKALAATTEIGTVRAIGLIETMSAPCALEAADAAAKSSNVTLVEIRLGRGMGSKSFFSFTGDVSDVHAAVETAKNVIEPKGLLVDVAEIAGPHPDLPAMVM